MISSRTHILRDTTGASIVIALVFFLICAIVGTVVVTAASVTAKTAETQRQAQQSELTMGSAAQTIGSELAVSKVDVLAPEGGAASKVVQKNPAQGFADEFWNTYGDDILAARKNHASFKTDAMNIEQGDNAIYAQLEVDEDLNMAIRLSLDESFASDSPYNMTVTVQCVPSFDGSGNLQSFSYKQALVRKTGGVA